MVASHGEEYVDGRFIQAILHLLPSMARLPRKNQSAPQLWITGLGTQYPEHRLTTQDLETLAATHYDVQSGG